MATIIKRQTADGKPYYTARVRLKGYPHKTATFRLLSDAKKWALVTETKIRAARVKALIETVF